MFTYMFTIGATDGNIIAAIMTTHVVMKKPKVPSGDPGPASIPDMRRSETVQATAARMSRAPYVARAHGSTGLCRRAPCAAGSAVAAMPSLLLGRPGEWRRETGLPGQRRFQSEHIDA